MRGKEASFTFVNDFQWKSENKTQGVAKVNVYFTFTAQREYRTHWERCFMRRKFLVGGIP